MNSVAITDNSSRCFCEVALESNRKAVFADLQNIANYSVKELLKQNSNLLVFPHCLNAVEDKFDDLKICSLSGSVENLQKSKIETTNLMGFVGSNNTELRIRSRFAPKDREDFFLHYMLQKVFSINVVDFKVSRDDDSVFDFLLYLFPHYLNRALSQGLYKEYQHKEYNDDRVRGPIDVSRHIRYNIPFNGKIAYHTREYSTDNRLTQLIRHTIEYIASTPQASILKNDRDCCENVAKIRMATPSYSLRNRFLVLSKNARPITNPYFTEYHTLQTLCVNILNHRKLKFGRSKNEVYGVLFDGAWLWEEYLWTILKKKGFEHPQNKLHGKPWHLFTNGRYARYPDFFNDKLILDAKYKHLARLDEEKLCRCVDRDDFHQMISYMHISEKYQDGNNRLGGFIFPDEKASLKSEKYEIGTLNGLGGVISLYGFPIPDGGKCDNFADFSKEMKLAEEQVQKMVV